MRKILQSPIVSSIANTIQNKIMKKIYKPPQQQLSKQEIKQCSCGQEVSATGSQCTNPSCKSLREQSVIQQSLVFKIQNVKKQKNKKLLVWSYNTWEGPNFIQLTKSIFDSHKIWQVKRIKSHRKIEPFSNQLQKNMHIMKVKIGQKQKYFASQPHLIDQYFNKIILARLLVPKIPYEMAFSGEISGSLLKKSDYWGIWDNRYVTISQKDGLKSYPQKNMPHSLHISSIKQLWTWFQIYQETHLIIKIRTDSKRQFGIPLGHLHQWIPAFYSLLTRPQNQFLNP